MTDTPIARLGSEVNGLKERLGMLTALHRGCAGIRAENARLRAQVSILEAGRCTSCMEPINPLHQQCACSRAEFEMLYHQLNETDTLRTQAEALATALETVLYYAETYTVARFERGKVAGARATLRAYREGGCPGCSFRRQTGGNHDDVPTGDADPNCAFREAPNDAG